MNIAIYFVQLNIEFGPSITCLLAYIYCLLSKLIFKLPMFFFTCTPLSLVFQFWCMCSIRVFKEMAGAVTCDFCSRLGQDGPTELVTSDLLTLTSGPEQ